MFASLEFRLTKIDETRNYLLNGIRHNDLMSEKYNKTCKYVIYNKSRIKYHSNHRKYRYERVGEPKKINATEFL